jgi:L-ribulokinase
MGNYVIGVDFGTLSGRALLADARTGEEIAAAVCVYPHAVMDRELPDGTALGADWALQHPQDWLDVLAQTVPEVMRTSGVSPQEVIGVGTDFTASTLLPVARDGTPLCFLPQYRSRPHAWPKLWKHHAAQDLADRITAAAQERGEPWLARYGGRVSSEWVFPKLWQVLREDPEIYAAAYRFTEAADWIVRQLCGNETYSACAAGYKAFWSRREGFPSEEFFSSLDRRLAHAAEEKLPRPILPPGSRAGKITPQAARMIGLLPGTPVAAGNVDAHACVPAAGIDRPGSLLAIMGTSTCHIVLSREQRSVPGICGTAEDGVLPGFWGYEAGQPCVGDLFAWYLKNALPAAYLAEAERSGENIHAFLRKKAERLKPGETGLLALDWWNGNRSVLADSGLSGMMLGMTLQTRPEDVYRALIEATAYGTRMILENFRRNGVPVEEFIAAGGISKKDPMTMQIYADVIGMPVKIAASAQGPALGSAIFASAAAGEAAGGYGSVSEAVRAMGKLSTDVFSPMPGHTAVYDRLYREYCTLHDLFGRGGSDVMKRLRALKNETAAF